MIISRAVDAHNFVYCMIYQGPNETTNYFNGNDGHFHHSIYFIQGTTDIWMADDVEGTNKTKLPSPLNGLLYNTQHTKDKYITATTGENFFSMISFNPVPTTRELSVSIQKGAQTINVEATDARKTIVCITGPVTVNDKSLQSTQYAVVFPNTSATLTMEENTICAIVS